MAKENILSIEDKTFFSNAKKTIAFLLCLFLGILVVFFGIKTYGEAKNIKNADKEFPASNTINISGKGEIFVIPDIAKISLSVEKEAQTVAQAQSDATQAMKKVMEFLKRSGIEEKDIKTVNYNIYPRYDYLEAAGRVFKGYTVSQSLEVKVRKTEKAGDILSGAATAGANQIGGIQFTIDDEEASKREARQKAITDAKQKADQLAKDLGVKLVRLVNFSENGSGDYYPYMSYKSDALGIGGGPESSAVVPAGENQVIAHVNLTYEIE